MVHRVYNSTTGKYMGYRYVLYSYVDKAYVERSGRARTKKRFDAWSGTWEQGSNCKKKFKIENHYELILDGEEFLSEQ